ncbi:uncharacterized protein LOC122527903 isoform X2 [Frieseomelitta varia]|uniref:uncharacterized protein LOC122527903 isoform X2 n=1 Tax=Frieseomelitta varia TaxID=561572 RepID=UPI001CB6A911|nr:uncharacterized protein LOC122527903 isoform X2 [Frieseomelitta varia]
MYKKARPYVCQIDAILPKQGKNGIRARGGKVGANEQQVEEGREREKHCKTWRSNVDPHTWGYECRENHGGIRRWTYVVYIHALHSHACIHRHTLALFRKSDNENTLRYTLVPEDIPIRKVYQKVQQLQPAGGGNPKLAVSDGAGRSLLVDSPSDRHRSVLVDRGNEKERGFLEIPSKHPAKGYRA